VAAGILLPVLEVCAGAASRLLPKLAQGAMIVKIVDCDEDCVKKDDDKQDCRKASKWDLQQAGIFDEHKYKRGHGAVPEARFDICKCKDGSVRIAAVGKCGKTSNFWD
ncbi:MAG: hypothetical protein AB1479_08210, partial [Pseudomonadota bacterium]